MKKTVLLIMAFILALSLFACGNENSEGQKKTTSPSVTDAPEKSTSQSRGTVSASSDSASQSESTSNAITQSETATATATKESTDATLFGEWHGKKTGEEDDTVEEYSYRLTLAENALGELVMEWDEGDDHISYSYSVTVEGESLRMKGKEYTKNGELMIINEDDFVVFSVKYTLGGGKLELGEAYDYDTVNYDMSYAFPVTLYK